MILQFAYIKLYLNCEIEQKIENKRTLAEVGQIQNL